MEQSPLVRASVYTFANSRGNDGSGRGNELAKGTEKQDASKGFSTGVDQEYERHLVAVAQEMMEKVEVKDRSHHFKTHRNCFIGKEAVKFLVWSGRAANVAEALAIGNALMQRGVFSHITNDHSFKNEDLFYRFNAGSLPQKGLTNVVKAAGGSSCSSLDSGIMPQASIGESLKQYSLDAPEELENRLTAVAKQLQDSLPVRDRFWHLKTHKSCFNGREAVKWLVENGHAGTDQEAVAIGEALLKRGTILSVTVGDTTFRNDDTLFRFRIHDELYLRGMTWVSTAGLNPQMKAAVKELMARVDVRDRAGRLVPHKSSFFGKDAVSCLIQSGNARNQEEAVSLGNALMNQQVFASVTGDYPFRNENLLYRFRAHEDDALQSEAALSRAASLESLRKLGWGSNSGEELSDEKFEDKLQIVAKALMAGLDIKDRSWHLKAYKRCFIGRDAVKFLLERGFASSIDVAIMVGNALLKRGILVPVTGDHTFKNEDLLYRFKAHDENVRKGLHWLSKSRGLDGKQEEAARAMLAKLTIKDRTIKFKKHKKCFSGREAVHFLVHHGFADSTDTALQLGNALMDKGVFSHITSDHAFKDEASLFYRFKAHEEEEGKGHSSSKNHAKASGHKTRAMMLLSKEAKGEAQRAANAEAAAGGLQIAAASGWKNIMQGLNELAINAVGVDSVFAAVELVGQESVATGLLHWGITHIVFALSYLDDSIQSGTASDIAIPKADDLLGKAGGRCNEALHYKPDLFQAAMMIAVIHHLRAVIHSGLLNVRETMAYFNACLASGGVLALETGEGAAAISLSTALEDGEDDPLHQFLALQASNLSSTQSSMQAEKVVSADIHFKASTRVMDTLIRMLPPEQRLQKRRGPSDSENGESQIWAAVGRPWKPLLDQAVDKLREGGAPEADIDLLIACHIAMQQAHH